MKALFIGRFQPFHLGHLLLLERLNKRYEEIVIGIGSSQYKETVDNPFSETERKKMITHSLDAVGIKKYRIVAIPDIHDPPRWVDHVCSIVSDFDVIIANNSFTKKLFSEKGYMVKGTKLFDRKQYSGKEIRRRMIQNEAWSELVPKAVFEIITDIDGVKRIKTLSHSFS